jgi:hypothetical protein
VNAEPRTIRARVSFGIRVTMSLLSMWSAWTNRSTGWRSSRSERTVAHPKDHCSSGWASSGRTHRFVHLNSIRIKSFGNSAPVGACESHRECLIFRRTFLTNSEFRGTGFQPVRVASNIFRMSMTGWKPVPRNSTTHKSIPSRS